MVKARPSALNTRLLVDSLWVLSTRVALRAANFVVFLLLARALSVAEFGFYGYVTATATVLSVAFDLGLRQSVAYVAGHDPRLRPAAVTHMLTLASALALVAAMACWAALASAGYGQAYGALILVGAAGTAPMLLLRTGQGAFLGGGQLGRMNATELVSRVVLLGGTAALFLAQALDITAALWILVLAHGAAVLWLVLQLRADLDLRSLVDLPLVRTLFRRGIVFASGILLMLLMGRVGIWVVAAKLGDHGVGLWFGVQRLGEMLVEVATSVGVVLFSHGVRSPDAELAARDAVRTARLVTACMVLAGLVTGVFARPFLDMFLGHAYAAQAGPFRIVMLGTVASCFNVMLYPTLGSQGLARWGVAAYLIGCIAALVITLALTGPLGLTGAALGSLIAQALVTATFLIAYRRRFGFHPAAVLVPQREDLAAIVVLARRRLGRGRRR